MSELSFLIDLLLNHKLPAPVKKLISDRIKDVEATLSFPVAQPSRRLPNSSGSPQAPSTSALMAKHGDIVHTPSEQEPPPVPVEQIAQTPAAVAAMQARNEAINAAVSGRNVMKDKGRMERTSPRKW